MKPYIQIYGISILLFVFINLASKTYLMDTNLSETEIIKWLAKHRWTFAKTMPEWPHEYIVKDRLSEEDKEMFVKVVIFIRENGYKETFNGQQYTYYDFEKYKYWTMGDVLEKTIILNRAKI